VWYGNDDYSPTNRMTGGSLPAHTWHDIKSVAHQGIEVKELAGVGMGTRLPQPATPQVVATAGGMVVAPRAPEIKPGPPPVLTKRGADILVQVEKLLDDAAKTADKTSATEQPKPAKPVQSGSLAFPDSFAAATPGDAAAPRKN
jgi:penicillin-binding protein 1A